MNAFSFSESHFAVGGTNDANQCAIHCHEGDVKDSQFGRQKKMTAEYTMVTRPSKRNSHCHPERP
jgi:hypothetical protein